MFFYLVDLFGTAVFAVSGVSLAFRLKMDAVGVLVLASVVAIGGGTIRDLILDVPVFWLTDNTYIWIVIATCALMIAFVKKPTRLPWWILPVSDAIGLALFAVMGAEKSLRYGFSPTVAVLMGTLTGCGGGAIRDVLAGEIPFIFQKEIYASACVVGAAVFCLLYSYQIFPTSVNMIIGMGVVLAIRLPAIKWQLSLPTFSTSS